MTTIIHDAHQHVRDDRCMSDTWLHAHDHRYSHVVISATAEACRIETYNHTVIATCKTQLTSKRRPLYVEIIIAKRSPPFLTHVIILAKTALCRIDTCYIGTAGDMAVRTCMLVYTGTFARNVHETNPLRRRHAAHQLVLEVRF